MNKTFIFLKKALHIIRLILQCSFYCVAAVLIILYICKIRFFVVMTGSMAPTIPTGSICVVNQNIPFSEITTGDVISFSIDEKMLVTHRVVKIETDGIVTRGDANNTDDLSFVTESCYKGKTICSIPKIGFLVTFFKTKGGFFLIILIFISFLLPGLNLKEKEQHHSL